MNTAALQVFRSRADVNRAFLVNPVRSDEKRTILARRFGNAKGYVARAGGWIYHYFGDRAIAQGWASFYNRYCREIEEWYADSVSEPTGLIDDHLAPEMYDVIERLVEAGARALAGAQMTKVSVTAVRLRSLERAYYRALSVILEEAKQPNPRVLANRLIRERLNGATRAIEGETKRALALEVLDVTVVGKQKPGLPEPPR